MKGQKIVDILNGEFDIFMMAKLELNNDWLITSTPYPVTFDGRIYSPSDAIIRLDPARYSATVDNESYSISMSGINDNLLAEIKSGIINKKITIYIGFIVDGQPKLALDEVIIGYSGTVSKPAMEIGETREVLLECSAPLSNLDASNYLYTTKDGIQNINPDDTSFDYIADGSGDKANLLWGKEGPKKSLFSGVGSFKGLIQPKFSR